MIQFVSWKVESQDPGSKEYLKLIGERMKWKNSSENFRDAEVVVPFKRQPISMCGSEGSTNEKSHCLASMVGYRKQISLSSVRRPRSAEPIASAGPAPRRDPEILCFVDDLAVAELHNTHRVCQSSLVRDCVFRDPRSPFPESA
jgi:hypothetical protein